MENKELTKDEILGKHPIVSDNKGTNAYVTLEAARLSMDKYADQWKVKYDELVVDNERLRNWKIEAVELLTKIYSYAHKHLEIKLGQCAVDFVIARSKERDELKGRDEKIEAALKQFVSYHETGLLPCRFTYEKGVEALKGEVVNGE